MSGRSYKKIRKDDEDKSTMKLDLKTLNWMCQYALSENQSIQISNLVNLRSLLLRNNPELYANEPDLLAR